MNKPLLQRQRTEVETALIERFDQGDRRLVGATDLRAAAMRRFAEAGLPNRRVESWHYTDLRGAMTPFGDFGPVHKGFKRTFDSILPQLDKESDRVITNADVVHCVGHSLGGAVATLVAAHYRQRGKKDKPRTGRTWFM